MSYSPRMKKNIYNKFPKRAITNLPRAVFTGRIIVILTANEAMQAVEYLLDQEILGVDTETRPSFRKGVHYQVSLLQVSTHDTCFLFRLNNEMMPALKPLLENTIVPMIGLSWHDDIHSLKERLDFTPGLFVDLQNIVGKLGIVDMSLQKLFANIFHQKISKRERLSNWEADTLSDKQQIYAATDAWACIVLYEEIIRLQSTDDYNLIVVPEENKNTSTTAADIQQKLPVARRKYTRRKPLSLTDKKKSDSKKQNTTKKP